MEATGTVVAVTETVASALAFVAVISRRGATTQGYIIAATLDIIPTSDILVAYVAQIVFVFVLQNAFKLFLLCTTLDQSPILGAY